MSTGHATPTSVRSRQITPLATDHLFARYLDSHCSPFAYPLHLPFPILFSFCHTEASTSYLYSTYSPSTDFTPFAQPCSPTTPGRA